MMVILRQRLTKQYHQKIGNEIIKSLIKYIVDKMWIGTMHVPHVVVKYTNTDQ